MSAVVRLNHRDLLLWGRGYLAGAAAGELRTRLAELDVETAWRTGHAAGRAEALAAVEAAEVEAQRAACAGDWTGPTFAELCERRRDPVRAARARATAERVVRDQPHPWAPVLVGVSG